MIEKISHTIDNYIFPLKYGFGIGYGIGQKYQPIWVWISVLDLNQNSSFGRTLHSCNNAYSEMVSTHCEKNKSIKYLLCFCQSCPD